MSTLLHLSLWLDGRAAGPADFARVLEVVREVNAPSPESVFRELYVAEGDSSNTTGPMPLRTNDVEEVMSHARRHVTADNSVEVASTYDALAYDGSQHALIHEKRRLVVNSFGPAYGWQGLYYKGFGPLRLDWFSTKNFGIPSSLVDATRRQAAPGASDGLAMMARLRENYENTLALARKLITALRPEHLVIYSDLELHPLTSHTIYHRDINEFANDLDKIVALHNRGGVYFTHVDPTHPSYLPPRSEKPSYGYLREELGPEWAADVSERVSAAADFHVGRALGADDIRHVLASAARTRTEFIEDGALLTSPDAPFDYLEEPYFDLFRAAQSIN